MLIATNEGHGWRYEVFVQSDGFLVQMRDLDTGRVLPTDSTLFRTAPVALAFAGMAAAADRYVSARVGEEAEAELEQEFTESRDHFAAIRARLSDDGVTGELLARRRASSNAKPRYH